MNTQTAPTGALTTAPTSGTAPATRRISATVASASWIPSEGIPAPLRLPFDLGMTHYDTPLPDRIDHGVQLEDMIGDDDCRAINSLHAWIDVDPETDTIVGHGQSGGGLVCSTTVALGSMELSRPGHHAPDLRPAPEVTDHWVRFTQTCGGRTWLPAPRLVARLPFVGFQAPPVWTTLTLTLHSDGRVEHDLIGASPFPRHWVYGPDGTLSTKSGVLGFRRWYRRAGGPMSPWGDRDLDVTTAPAETDAERRVAREQMSRRMTGPRRRLGRGQVLATQGDDDATVWLVLDGTLDVEIDGRTIGPVGPGWVVGEHALLGDGRRTATLRATAPVHVTAIERGEVDEATFEALAECHRREELDRV